MEESGNLCFTMSQSLCLCHGWAASPVNRFHTQRQGKGKRKRNKSVLMCWYSCPCFISFYMYACVCTYADVFYLTYQRERKKTHKHYCHLSIHKNVHISYHIHSSNHLARPLSACRLVDNTNELETWFLLLYFPFFSFHMNWRWSYTKLRLDTEDLPSWICLSFSFCWTNFSTNTYKR